MSQLRPALWRMWALLGRPDAGWCVLYLGLGSFFLFHLLQGNCSGFYLQCICAELQHKMIPDVRVSVCAVPAPCRRRPTTLLSAQEFRRTCLFRGRLLFSLPRLWPQLCVFVSSDSPWCLVSGTNEVHGVCLLCCLAVCESCRI